jgi:putative transposase
MFHSLVKIWIHLIFGTKNSEPLIIPKFEKQLYNHIKNKLEKEFDCFVKIINGISDHIHILFLLSPNYSLSNILTNIKGESSHWWNSNEFSNIKFAWQIGYSAYSVSESMVSKVESYIANQKEHHKKISYKQEVELFIKKYGLQIYKPLKRFNKFVDFFNPIAEAMG